MKSQRRKRENLRTRKGLGLSRVPTQLDQKEVNTADVTDGWVARLEINRDRLRNRESGVEKWAEEEEKNMQRKARKKRGESSWELGSQILVCCRFPVGPLFKTQSGMPIRLGNFFSMHICLNCIPINRYGNSIQIRRKVSPRVFKGGLPENINVGTYIVSDQLRGSSFQSKTC